MGAGRKLRRSHPGQRHRRFAAVRPLAAHGEEQPAADRVEVLEGLEPGDSVVVKGFLGLSDGKSVKRVAPEA